MTRSPIIEVDSTKLVTFSHIEVPHGCTTRLGGVSEGHLESLNTGFTVGDDPVHVWENRARIAPHFGAENLPWLLSMTHGTQVAHIDRRIPLPEDLSVSPGTHFSGDGSITDLRDQPLGLTIADCVPVFFYDPVKGAVGVSHAGWRGTVNGIVTKTIQQMAKRYGSRPQDILIGIGPSIGPESFEVGSEVADEFRREFSSDGSVVRPHPDPAAKKAGKAYVDLWRANALMAHRAGARASNVEVSGWCTVSHPDLFFSHRRDRGLTGRLLAVITLP